jgi:hypothetical protein
MFCGNLRLDGALDLRMDPRRRRQPGPWSGILISCLNCFLAPSSFIWCFLSLWSFVFCCLFCCCGNLGLSMPAEVGMSSSTLSLVRRSSCVPGPVSNKRMAYLVNLPSHGISSHSYICLCPYSLVPTRPTLLLFDVYTQRVHRSCPVDLRGCLSCCI